MKTKQELYEEARQLVAKIASHAPEKSKYELKFQEEAQKIRDAFFDAENPTPCKFAQKAIHTRCRAFLNEEGNQPYEILEEDFQTFEGDHKVYHNYHDGINNKNHNSRIDGTFHYVNDSASELKLVLDDFDRREIVYWLLWNQVEGEYVVYTPYLNYEKGEK
tara:strand:+ start:58 stop:543 length:486 start_codon:yes stop_codon:yes gene_type:complete